MRGGLLAVISATLLLAAAAAAGGAAFADRIDSPAGGQPEGSATGGGDDLFVGSIPSGAILRIDARTGEREIAVPADLALTRDAASFTASQRPALNVVDSDLPGARELPLVGFELLSGLNLNGIVASPNGATLLAAQSNAGRLWRIDADTGAAHPVDLGGASLAGGDRPAAHRPDAVRRAEPL